MTTIRTSTALLTKAFPAGFGRSAAILIGFFVLAEFATAQREIVIHNFGAGTDGNQVNASLIVDTQGNLYGTTTGGGDYDSGIVYELVHRSDGSWAEKRLHDFGKGTDGSLPWSGVVFDPKGNLYGDTSFGGSGCGIVYQLMPQTNGSWTENILYNFPPCEGYPFYTSLTLDSAGNLYGSGPQGTFELTRTQSGEVTEKILCSCGGSALIFDASGNLYATNSSGGPGGGGTVLKLTPDSSGNWTETTLYGFRTDGQEGSNPYSAVTFDSAGNLYGTTGFGGAYGKGVVYELSPGAGVVWSEKVLHSFDSNGVDGWGPVAGVVFDQAGNLYGTTVNGGYLWRGAVYELTPNDDGSWSEQILHSFGAGYDAEEPRYGLAIDAIGNLFGTTTDGGINDGPDGTAYEVIP